MFDPELTSEDKLLKIIESPSAVKKDSPALFSAGGLSLKNVVVYLRNMNFAELAQKIRLRTVNRMVLALCGILTVICLVNFNSSRVKYNKMYQAMSTEVPADPDVEKTRIADSINLQQTLTMAKQHNIFTLEHASATSEGLMVGQSQEVANLRLVGIMWSGKPQAMIEDVIDHKTYLLGAGDQVGRLTVREIQKDKVVLGRQEHIWELR